MKDTRRDQIEACIKREFIGPDPIEQEGYISPKGEEILHGDPPRVRYIAGVLYPQETVSAESDIKENEDQVEQMEFGEHEEDNGEKTIDTEIFADPDQAEELINRSNAYHQSALSLTCAVQVGSSIIPTIEAAIYLTIKSIDPKTGKEVVRYQREPIKWENDGKPITIPDAENPLVSYSIEGTHLQFDVTWRYHKDDADILTFTLENASKSTGPDSTDSCCYFQVEFSLINNKSFLPMPVRPRVNTKDEDWLSNQLLYREIKNYAIGHGCATDWEETENGVFSIKTVIFPSWEVKPIIPATIPGVLLSMSEFGPKGDIKQIINTLTLLCDRYSDWIEKLTKKRDTLDSNLQITADRHISNCKTCLSRMRDGIALLESNPMVQTAFQYMNQAMLEQQIHYNLPLQHWNASIKEFDLVDPVITLPDADKPETWPGDDKKRFGKWRPFQLAFILMNLRSMAEPRCTDRRIVDLIWFPTGGGKTEAYLGLSAYTIFMRRLQNHDDHGTAILMRYTLRLLTAQQYERASAMICACDLIRKEHEDLFGKHRISIGLWVGGDTTPNHMKDAVHDYEQLYSRKTEKILLCY